MNRHMKAVGLGEFTDDEIRSVASQPTPGQGLQQGIGQGVQQGIGAGPQQGIGQGVQQGILAGMPQINRLGGGQIQSQMPIAGFQGSSQFPNQAGTGRLPHGMAPPGSNPGFSGMDLNIRLGPDGQPQQMLLRRLRAGARRQV